MTSWRRVSQASSSGSKTPTTPLATTPQVWATSPPVPRFGPLPQYRVGSITKTFVATIVLQLVGEGRLRLDEPVATRLPGLLPNRPRITVRQLLNHTSGLPDYIQDPELFAGIDKNRVWAPRELVALADKHPMLFAPGSAWSYSNTNYIVAGLLIQAGHRPLPGS